METIDQVRTFHNRMGIKTGRVINISSDPLNSHRITMMGNELFKLNYALQKEDKISALEYLMNLQYELDSTMLTLGFAKYKDEAFCAVHEANMTKLDDNGYPVIVGDGQIAETKNYVAPNLLRLIR